MLRASRLPVPAGIRPNGMPGAGQTGADHPDRAVAAGAEHQVDPGVDRLCGHRPPGSSMVVSSHSARSQPRLFSSYSTCRRKVTQSVHLGRVVDHRAALRSGPVARRSTARLPDELGDELVRDRHPTPAIIRATVADERAEQRAADDVGDVVRAEQPAVDGRRASTRPTPPTCQISRARTALPGDREGRADRDRPRRRRRSCAPTGSAYPCAVIRSSAGGRPGPPEDELGRSTPRRQPSDDGQHQGDGQLAQPVLDGPDRDAERGRGRPSRPGQQRERGGDLRQRGVGSSRGATSRWSSARDQRYARRSAPSSRRTRRAARPRPRIDDRVGGRRTMVGSSSQRADRSADLPAGRSPDRRPCTPPLESPALGGVGWTGDRRQGASHRPRPRPRLPARPAASRCRWSTTWSPPTRPGARRSRSTRSSGPSRRSSASRSPGPRATSGPRCWPGPRSSPTRSRRPTPRRTSRRRLRPDARAGRQPGRRRTSRPGGEDDYVVLETHGTPRDFAAEGFDAARPPRARAAARRDRRRARRQGVRLAVLLPDRAGRRARAGADQPGHEHWRCATASPR